MKPSLQLRVSQNLAMTPQLQQAIRLLQLSSLELKTEIQNALDSNMMLEIDEGDENTPQNKDNESENEQDTKELDLKEDFETLGENDDLPVETAWEDLYEGTLSYANLKQGDDQYFEPEDVSEKNLKEHLLWQLNLLPLSDSDRTIAVTIIDFIDKDGYFTSSLGEILSIITNETEADIEEVEAMLSMVQSMEPAGVGARDLKECLGLQLSQIQDGTKWLKEAASLVNYHLDLLASHDYTQLMRKLAVSRADLSEIISLIQSLNPRPGSAVQDIPVQYVIPDVFVKKANGRWIVELNAESTPRLRINSSYADMIKRADNSPDNNSLKEHLQEARWLIKSLQSRSETLLRVSASIVERQKTFLDLGEQAMKPLVLHDIAEELGLHESTISRVTSNKYMHTPRGIYELKYFFSSHVSTNSGDAASSTAIRALIKKLVSEENPQKPYSDSKIASMLAEQGINVARRTIAKYREALSIPPSNERKRLI